MARTRIPINPGGSGALLAPQVQHLANQLAELRSLALRLIEYRDQAAAGGDYAYFNELFAGAQMPEEVNPDALHNLLGGVAQALDSPAVRQFASRVAVR